MNSLSSGKLTFRKWTQDNESHQLVVTVRDSKLICAFDRRQEALDLVGLEDPKDLDYLSLAKQSFPQMFSLNTKERILIDCPKDLEPELMLLLKDAGKHQPAWAGASQEFLEFAEDFGLPRDRELRINDAPWAAMPSGCIVPWTLIVDRHLVEPNDRIGVPIFKMGWMETASMTSGWDSLNLYQVTDEVGYISSTNADDTWDIETVYLDYFAIPTRVVNLIERASQEWNNAWEDDEALKKVIINFLELGSREESYWGLNLHMREGTANSHDCDAECFPAWPSSYWTFEQSLEGDQKTQVLSKLRS